MKNYLSKKPKFRLGGMFCARPGAIEKKPSGFASAKKAPATIVVSPSQRGGTLFGACNSALGPSAELDFRGLDLAYVRNEAAKSLWLMSCFLFLAGNGTALTIWLASVQSYGGAFTAGFLASVLWSNAIREGIRANSLGRHLDAL